jgi:hypothetical protein
MKLFNVLKAFWCKHVNTEKSSCPFTAKTYETCNDCGQMVSVMITHS